MAVRDGQPELLRELQRVLMPPTEAAPSTQRLGAAQRDTACSVDCPHRRAGGAARLSRCARVAGPHRASRRRRHRATRRTATSSTTCPLGGCLRRRFWVSCAGTGDRKRLQLDAGHGAPRGRHADVYARQRDADAGSPAAAGVQPAAAGRRKHLRPPSPKPGRSGPAAVLARGPARLRASADTVLEGSSALAGDVTTPTPLASHSGCSLTSDDCARSSARPWPRPLATSVPTELNRTSVPCSLPRLRRLPSGLLGGERSCVLPVEVMKWRTTAQLVLLRILRPSSRLGRGS